jgi:hypothetical protein
MVNLAVRCDPAHIRCDPNRTVFAPDFKFTGTDCSIVHFLHEFIYARGGFWNRETLAPV